MTEFSSDQILQVKSWRVGLRERSRPFNRKAYYAEAKRFTSHPLAALRSCIPSHRFDRLPEEIKQASSLMSRMAGKRNPQVILNTPIGDFVWQRNKMKRLRIDDEPSAQKLTPPTG